MNSLHAVSLSPELIKLFGVAVGKVPFDELNEDEIAEASLPLVKIADRDSATSLLKVLPDSSRAVVEARLANDPVNKNRSSQTYDFYWLYDSFVLMQRGSIPRNKYLLEQWLDENEDDRLKKMEFKFNDFEFLFPDEKANNAEEAHKEMVGIGKRYFTLLTKVAQARINLDNDSVGNLFLMEFGHVFTSEDRDGPTFGRESKEYKGFVNLARKVLANPSGATSV